ncbi:protein phosphatase Slingshot isoform X3 [Coccinella septempunctata]|uniref:protein phosphatase Slingshot isoform X3 n=1 Tax=Coccinella septempunctata TaxID=41139 RepID=UPI001D0978CA|nr:protein phosphatase Slingshot isoform X3 [Coccinella septempunctata]
MALVTVQRSPSSKDSPSFLVDGLSSQNEMDPSRSSKSLSECYFAGKGTALVLPDAEASTSPQRGVEGGGQRPSVTGTSIQKHLQSMFYLLRPEETLKMLVQVNIQFRCRINFEKLFFLIAHKLAAPVKSINAVKLESMHTGRTRYLVVVSRMGNRGEESCLLGIDCNERTTVGLVLRVLADTSIRLDGDGGFSVSVCGKHHIFKPVSVQAMWSALQTLHKASSKAREQNYFQAGLTHGWVDYYEARIESDRSCLNEWHAMDNLESKRPPSPDSIRTKPTEREETERVIRSTLKEIMMSVDLDEVTSKYIRTRLEEELDVDLGEYKSFIDQEMLTILGQMDAPTEIFEHVYLGSEWNASNFEELRKNGVGHILNVTKEIDNFFPGTFDYLNIRVYDDEKTDLLKHWDDTFKYITKARNAGSKVLVHCKMGVSRSASVVIAYAMKAYNWDFKTAWKHVKGKRTCIKPNTAFLAQLETYRGILDAMQNKEKLQRSKSETNLKKSEGGTHKNPKVLIGSEPTPIIRALDQRTTEGMSGIELRNLGLRPKSWSPDCGITKELTTVGKSSPVFLSLEDLSQKSSSRESVRNSQHTPDRRSFLPRHMLMPCDNGESYSVSPNQIVHLPGQHADTCVIASVKDRIIELESNAEQKLIDRKKLVLNLANQIDAISSELQDKTDELRDVTEVSSRQIPNTDTWDPGEAQVNLRESQNKNSCSEICDFDNAKKTSAVNQPVWTSSTVLKTLSKPQPIGNNNKVPESQKDKSERKDCDPFSNVVDRVFDREEKKQQRVSVIPVLPVQEQQDRRECPSRQNSWSSYDSAVVMGGQTELSRHSSWGSGDTRTLPSRNSSWGSYDIRQRGSVHYTNERGEKVAHNAEDNTSSDRDDVPWWHSGTVRRTKQKLESSASKRKSGIVDTMDSMDHSDSSDTTENTESSKESLKPKKSSAISTSIEIPKKVADIRQKDNYRLSLSAPEPSSMNLVVKECSLSRCASNESPVNKIQPSSVKQHRTFLENLHKEAVQIKKTDESLQNSNISGIVRSLKREFEAKTVTTTETTNNDPSDTRTKSKGGSLPSSPTSVHVERAKPPEDLNLKNLIGIFESNKQEENKSPPVCQRPKFSRSESSHNKSTARYSCIEVSTPFCTFQTPLIANMKKNVEGEFKRPPVPPVVRKMVAATVIATAAKKQQQFGKSHPLARLNIKPRHNNPVYNTM